MKHKIQITFEEDTGQFQCKHYVKEDFSVLEKEDPKEPDKELRTEVHTVTHHEDVELPDEIKKELLGVMEKIVKIDRNKIARRTMGHKSRHEFFFHTLPREVAEGRTKIVGDKIVGTQPPTEEK